MLSLAWFVLRAAFWLGLVGLFLPGSLPFQAIIAKPVESIVERAAARDTLTPADRVPSWRGPRPDTKNRRARSAREGVPSGE